MPAIQLSRLKAETASLGQKFDYPIDFLHQLRDLLEAHANLVYRSGQTVHPVKKLRVLHIPPLVLDQIESDLRHLCRKNPESALILIDALWESNTLEERLIATGFIGQLPLDYSDKVVQRIKAWSQPGCEETVLIAILNDASFELRQEAQELWLDIIHDWLESSTLLYQKLGLKSLLPLLNDDKFVNLPLIFRLIDPVIRIAPSTLQVEIQSVLAAFALRAPEEIGYYLQRIILTEPELSPETAHLMRRTIPNLPEGTQTSLRELLKGISSL
jgi:hypothetical protein